MTKISVVIVNWNTKELLRKAIESLLGIRPNLEIIVVDNGSSDGSQAMIKNDFPQAILIANSTNNGFAKANNQGVAVAKGEFVLLFNSDAWITQDIFEPFLFLMKAHPRAAIIGGHLRNPIDTFQASHTPFPSLYQEFMVMTGLGRRLFKRNYPTRGPEVEKGSQCIDFVEGACMFVRKTAFDQVGGFDESYFMYSEDVELCLRLTKAGWQIWYHPEARVFHMSAGSSRHQLTSQAAQMYASRVKFFREHNGAIQAHLLRLMILSLTAIKKVTYGTLRLITRRKVGRDQLSLRTLNQKLSAQTKI